MKRDEGISSPALGTKQISNKRRCKSIICGVYIFMLLAYYWQMVFFKGFLGRVF